MPTLPTGTVTFLFIDIEGSTDLLQRFGYIDVKPHRRIGQPKHATEEKGRRVFDHVASRMVEMVRSFRSRPHRRGESGTHRRPRSLPFGF